METLCRVLATIYCNVRETTSEIMAHVAYLQGSFVEDPALCMHVHTSLVAFVHVCVVGQRGLI